MKKLLLALALLLPPNLVHAKTILVWSGGSSSIPADSGAAMPGVRLSVANAIAIPGDKVVILDDGNGSPAPVNSGSTTASIAFVGYAFAGNVRATASTEMPNMNASASFNGKSRITYKGLKFTEGSLGNRCSLAYCRIERGPTGNYSISTGDDNGMLVGNYIQLNDWFLDCDPCSGNDRAYADTVRNNGIYLNKYDNYQTFWRGMTRFVVDSNYIKLEIPLNAHAGTHHNLMNWCQENKFIGNTFEFSNPFTSSARLAFQVRDSTRRNVWTGNTFNVLGPGNSRFGMHNTGGSNFVGDNRWDGNTLKNPYGDGFFYATTMVRDTFTNNTVATYGPSAFLANTSITGPILMRHNTFWTWRTSGDLSTSYGVVTLAGGDAGGWTDSVYFTSNIVATHTPRANVPAKAGAVHFWTSLSGYTPCKYKANYNLYYYPFYKDSVGDRAIYMYTAGGTGDHYGRVGYGKRFWILTGANGNARDSASVHGDPLFADTNSVESFNPSLLSGSPGIAATFPDGYAGSVYTDGIRPAAVSDLAVATDDGHLAINNTSVRVSWTATGDDSLTYTATAYDIRVSLSAITTEASFDTAGAVFSGLIPNPTSPGTGQEIIIPGLGAAQTYYVAMRVIDDRGNQSAISNVISFTTKSNNAGGGGDPHYLPPDEELSP